VIPSAEDVRQSTLFVRASERVHRQRLLLEASDRELAETEAKQVYAAVIGVPLAPPTAIGVPQAPVTATGVPQEAEWEWSAEESGDEEAQLEGRLARLREGRGARRRRRGW
jgi:hypothetical protein